MRVIVKFIHLFGMFKFFHNKMQYSLTLGAYTGLL